MVSWQSKSGESYDRFYHVFRENELEDLIAEIKNVKIIESFYDFGNWGVIIDKSR